MESAGKITVWPKAFPVGPIPNFENDSAISGNVSRSKAGSFGDVVGVRSFRRGDLPKRIHWGQSAKHDRFIVCELGSTSRSSVVLAIDTEIKNHTLGSNGSLEWSIRIIASFAKGWIEAGSEVGLIVGKTVIPASTGNRQLIRIIDRLAAIDCKDYLPFAELATSLTKDHSIIACTDLTPTNVLGQAVSYKLAELKISGFGGIAKVKTAKEPTRKAWLTIQDIDSVSDSLRQGWEEAKHGG